MKFIFSIYVSIKALLPTNMVADSSRDKVRICRPLNARFFISINFVNLKLYCFCYENYYDVSNADSPIICTAGNYKSVPVNSQL